MVRSIQSTANTTINQMNKRMAMAPWSEERDIAFAVLEQSNEKYECFQWNGLIDPTIEALDQSCGTSLNPMI
jgi:hypothetical protein